MPSLRPRLLAAILVPVVLLTAGCETTQVAYVDPSAPTTGGKGPAPVVGLNQINVQDWQQAADKMVTSLLASGVLQRAPQQPAILQISRFVNNTQQQVDTDSLVKKIRIQLLNSGKVITMAEDRLAQEQKEMEDMLKGKKREVLFPYYTLSGKLLEDRVRDGTRRQTTYTFHLTLTTVQDNLGVWEAEEHIMKQANDVGKLGF